MSKKNASKKGNGLLGSIEELGNKLPHPVVIFVILALIIIVISEITARAGINASYFDPRTNEDVTTYAVSLMNKKGIAYIFNNATSNFTGFAPLGTVLVAMLGVGVAEWTGL